MKQNKTLLKVNTLYLVLFVIGLLLFRLFLLADLPLLDRTESRYAEIARLMEETGEWVVLQIDYGVPFWAKPPLSTWLSASSFELFGVNAFAARLPSFLLSLSIIFILVKYILKDKSYLFLLGFIFLTIPEFLLHTGVVSTDTALCFSIVLIMISFWKAINEDGEWYWKYIFFVGVALGFLSKGPLVLVLTGPPILIWLIIQRVKLITLWKNLPWIVGILITAIIAVPWYILAEMRSPGFIDYFIVGEHIKRFLEPKWRGDLYGGPKSEALGMIWVFLLVFAFPWIQIVMYKLWKIRKKIFKDPWVSFLVLWLFWTPIFFSISKNILHTYILPSTVPLGLLVVYFWKDLSAKKWAVAVASMVPVLAFIFFFGIRYTDVWEDRINTNKYLIQDVDPASTPIFFWTRRMYSAEFYSNGEAQLIKNEIQLDSVSEKHDTFYLLMLSKNRKEIPPKFNNRMKLKDSTVKTSLYIFNKSDPQP